ncbi:MAG TPA: trypsin-like serine protease [Iamia sp.]|nr:trypsin-like serine protease [Iamia sp.]
MDPSPGSSLRHRLVVAVVGVLTVCGLAAVPTAAEEPPPAPEPRSTRPETRIVGGTQADDGAWPSMVALVWSDDPDSYQNQFCGGTLVARTWVLTAGHCLLDLNHAPTPDQVDVLVGTQDLTTGGVRIRAVEFRLHPSWPALDGRNDLALIRLDHPAPSGIPFQKLTAQNVSPAAGTPVTTMGWGITAYETGSFPTKLRQVTVPVSTPTACGNAYPGFYQQSTMVCAGAAGKDACQGDSGGPLVEDRGGTWVQVGIVSTGDECGREGSPGIYTRVAAYATWIAQQIRYGPHPDAASFVRRMHLDAYNRQPTTSELYAGVYALDSGQQSPQVYARRLLDQTTFQNRTGGVVRLYQAIFLRRPDTAGLEYWWKEVNRGVSLTRVADLMVRAPEFRTLYGDLDNAAFVRRVYQNVLDRNPGPNELAYWVGELDSGRRSRGGVMIGFSQSPEYRAKIGTRTRVIADYFALLRRVPSTADIEYWSGQSSSTLATTIVRGWEYANRF